MNTEIETRVHNDKWVPFEKWITKNRRLLTGATVGAFLRFAEHERLRGESTESASQSMIVKSSRAIESLEEVLKTKLTSTGRGRKRLTEEGTEFACLLERLCDFVSYHQEQPHRWCIGAQDSVLHWLLVPVLGSIQREIVKWCEEIPSDIVRRKPIVFELKDVRSRDFEDAFRTNAVQIAVVRRGFLKNIREEDTSSQKCLSNDVRALERKAKYPHELVGWDLGSVGYHVCIPKELREKLQAITPKPPKLKGSKEIDWLQRIPFAVVKDHEIKCETGKDQWRTKLEDIAQENGLSVHVLCESPSQAAQGLISKEYAVILTSFACSSLPPEDYEFQQPPFLKSLPEQHLVLVCKRMFLEHNQTARKVIELLRGKLQKKLAEPFTV